MDICVAPLIWDKNAPHPSFMCNDDQCNLFLHCDSFIFENICLWQYCINKRCIGDDQVSSIWSQSFVYKSATTDFPDRFDSKYKDLSAHDKHWVTYLFHHAKMLFFRSYDTINALRKYLKLFEDMKEDTGCMSPIKWSGTLVCETVNDMLTDMTNCSVSNFVKVFYFLLKQAKAKALDTDTHEGDTLKQVKTIWVRLLMLTIVCALQASGKLEAS